MNTQSQITLHIITSTNQYHNKHVININIIPMLREDMLYRFLIIVGKFQSDIACVVSERFKIFWSAGNLVKSHIITNANIDHIWNMARTSFRLNPFFSS